MKKRRRDYAGYLMTFLLHQYLLLWKLGKILPCALDAQVEMLPANNLDKNKAAIYRKNKPLNKIKYIKEEEKKEYLITY